MKVGWVGKPVSWAWVSPKQPSLAKLPQTGSTLQLRAGSNHV